MVNFKQCFVALLLGIVSCIRPSSGDEPYPGIRGIRTEEATDITENDATLSGIVSPTADMQDVMVGFLWSTDSQPDIENSTTVRVDSWQAGKAYFLRLSNLIPGQTYYYKAYVRYNGSVYNFGDVKQFTTKDVTAAFVLNDAGEIGQFTVHLSGSMNQVVPGEILLKYWGEHNIATLPKDYFRVSQSADGSFDLYVSRLKAGSRYYFRAETEVMGKRIYSETKSFETVGFQYVAPEAVDLGLSVLWGAVNVGAVNPENEGAYFSWGETEPKSRYGEDNYWGYVDKLDVATALLGDGWRMPTKEEMSELINSCTWSRENVNGVPCYRITSQVSGYTDASILLPATGYFADDLYQHWSSPEYRFNYWTGSIYEQISDWPKRASAFTLLGYGPHGNRPGTSYSRVYEGLPVRPVKER